MTSQEEAIQRILKRERLARKQAEEVIERKSLELFKLNEELKKANQELEERILVRTGELREKNLQLKQSEAKINLAIESAELGIWEWDLVTEELYFSEQIASSGGYTIEEFSSKFDSFYELIHPNDREGFREKMVDHLKGKSEQFNKEIQLKKKSGSYLWLFVAGKITTRNIDGKATKIIGVYQDITEQKEFQNSLELLIKMAKTFINMPIENLDHEINNALAEIGKYVNADRAYIFDYLFDKGITTNTYEWCNEGITPEIDNLKEVPLEMLPQWVDEHKNGNEMYIKDVLSIPKNNPLRDVLEPQGIKSLLTLPIFKNEVLIGFVGFDSVLNHHQYTDKERSILTFFVELLVNVRSRIDSLQQISEAKERAENASQAKADFLSTMSHELRTPLNGVIGTTNLLMDTNPTEEQMRLLQALEFSGKTLMNIINDILDFSKIESGKISLQQEVFNLKDLMNSIHSTFQLKADEKNIDLHLECQKGMPEIVFGDSGKLLQVMNNLIGNAIKFTDEGSVTVNGNYDLKNKGEVTLSFEIKDTGIGIAKENYEKVFESFSQEGAYINRKFGGTGLGLAITKKLIELQKGTISLESELGKGTTFQFSIPHLIPKKPTKPKSKVKTEQDSPFDLNNARILVVEDNPMNQMIAETFLQKWNAEVTICNNGKEAVDVLQKETFDLILMDIQMPVMDGYKATEIIRNELKLKSIPIIALTASALLEVSIKIKEAGMNDLVTKPFDPKSLFAKVLKNLYK